ncbi:MAG: hypothetical protein PHY54_08205 [Methylococcales bacterium]|nr:hypothetical protein [Methylococcales bacterium]
MATNKTAKLHSIIFAFMLRLGFIDATAKPRIAVLDFELKDVTFASGAVA